MSTPPGQEQLNWALERGGTPVTVVNAGGSGGQLCTGIGLITCITIANNSFTVGARFVLCDGTDSSGPRIAALAVAAGAGTGIPAGMPGIYFGTGLYLNVLSGLANVTVTYIPLTLPLK